MIKTFRLPQNWKLVVDTSEIIPEDPGAGTPALVYSPDGRHTGSMWCAIDAGDCDGINIPGAVIAALENLVDQVDAMLMA